MRRLSVPDVTRYADSVNPVKSDGRDIDPSLGSLVGEASHQRTGGHSDHHIDIQDSTWQSTPGDPGTDVTYYDRSLLQMPVWEWVIPAYYYVGGVTGAALVLGAAAQLRDGEAHNKLIKRCHSIAFVGSGLSAFFLIYDLGQVRNGSSTCFAFSGDVGDERGRMDLVGSRRNCSGRAGAA